MDVPDVAGDVLAREFDSTMRTVDPSSIGVVLDPPVSLVFDQIRENLRAIGTFLWLGMMDDFQVGLSSTGIIEGFVALRARIALGVLVLTGHVFQ